MKRLFNLLAIICWNSLFAFLEPSGSFFATPVVFKIPVQRIDFYDSSKFEWITFFNEFTYVDIASVGPFGDVSILGRGLDFPYGGPYTKIRFIIHPDILVTASTEVSPGGPIVRTNTGNPHTTFDGYTQLSVASTDPGLISEEVVHIPIDQVALPLLAIESIAPIDIDGITYISKEMNLSSKSFFISSSKAMPKITIRYDLTNSVEFLFLREHSVYVILPREPKLRLLVD